jgi:ribosomal protein L29
MLSAARPFGAATRTPATATAAAGRSSSSLLVCRAKPTRASDFRGLDNAELLAKVDELKREKMRLQYMQKTRGNILNPGSVSARCSRVSRCASGH